MGDETVVGNERVLSSELHYLPCSINFDGAAGVKSFFHIEGVKGEADLYLTSHLRGRKLSGREIKLPSSVTEEESYDENGNFQSCPAVVGLCVRDCGDMKWVVEGKFTSISEWMHDGPFNSSQIDHHLAWFLVADQVSAPLIEKITSETITENPSTFKIEKGALNFSGRDISRQESPTMFIWFSPLLGNKVLARNYSSSKLNGCSNPK